MYEKITVNTHTDVTFQKTSSIQFQKKKKGDPSENQNEIRRNGKSQKVDRNEA